jgi:hypothetical protein
MTIKISQETQKKMTHTIEQIKKTMDSFDPDELRVPIGIFAQWLHSFARNTYGPMRYSSLDLFYINELYIIDLAIGKKWSEDQDRCDRKYLMRFIIDRVHNKCSIDYVKLLVLSDDSDDMNDIHLRLDFYDTPTNKMSNILTCISQFFIEEINKQFGFSRMPTKLDIYNTHVEELREAFSEFREPLNNDQLEHCPIYCEPIFNKITTNCGHSFERSALLEHLKRIPTCPLCRASITVK